MLIDEKVIEDADVTTATVEKHSERLTRKLVEILKAEHLDEPRFNETVTALKLLEEVRDDYAIPEPAEEGEEAAA